MGKQRCERASGCDGSERASLMTGREWYAVSWNAAPTGPSWGIKRAPHGLLHLVPVSGQNRIWFEQREEGARVPGCVFFKNI